MAGIVEVLIENTQDKQEFTPELEDILIKVAQNVIEQEDFAQDCEVSVSITDDADIHRLNLQHRGKDTPTDVLSFPMLEFDDDGEPVYDFLMDETDVLPLGDIVISLERAVAQADDYGHSIQREVGFLTAHSMLHLLGYDHEDGELSREIMRTKEEAALSAIGLER